MKKISVLIPCYNEKENVGPISQAVTGILEKELPQYDYELVFIDNDSTDGTRDIIRGLCQENPRIKAIFNARTFGQFNSPYYGMLQVTGDSVIELVGKGIQDCHRHQDQQPGKPGDVLAEKLLLPDD